MTSIPQNIAEGNGRLGKDRIYHFSIAEGSARELQVALRVLEVLHVVPAHRLEAPLQLLDRVLGMLYRLTR